MNYLKPLETKICITLDSDIVSAVWLFVNNNHDSLSLLINKLLRTHIHEKIISNETCQ